MCTICFAQDAIVRSVEPMDLAPIDTPLAYPSRAATPPVIDGQLDDACWQNAETLGPFRDNLTGGAALEPTTFKICYDDRAIYIAVDAVEQQLDLVTGKPQGDKEDVWSGDETEIFIAPTGDGRTYYHFCVGGAHGQRYDARSDIGRTYHNKDWQSAVGRDEKAGRLYTEVAIPYSAFDMDAAPQGAMWRFNVARKNIYTERPATDFGQSGGDSSKEQSQWSVTGPNFHVLNRFGRLFFGTPDQFAERREPLHATLVLDRYAYDHLDGSGVGVITANAGGRGFDELAATLTLVCDGSVISMQADLPITSANTAFHLPITSLDTGRYKLIATLITGDAEPATATWDFDVTDAGLADGVTRAGRIHLNLPPRDEDKRDFAWPVRTGVPFPQGALDSPDHVRLLVNGQPAPAQTSVRAVWGPGASIRWLGLTFIAHDPDATYELEYGENITPPAPKQHVTATAGDNAATVDTGPLRFTVTRAGLTHANLNGKQLIDGNAQTSPYLIDQAGTTYRAALDADAVVEIEESGPLHAVVRATGWFTSADGARLCQYTTYYEAFAGLPHVFVDHAVTITYDTTKNKLRDVAFPVAATGSGDFAFGIEDGKAVTGSRAQRAYAVQDRHDHYLIGGATQHEGKHLAGWADVGGAGGGVTVAGQYVWQRYPAEFSVDDRTLTYHLWPADLGDTFSDEEELHRNEIYKMLSAHEGPALDFSMEQKYFDQVAEFAGNEVFQLSYAKKGLDANAQGVAINAPFIITFRDTPLDANRAEALTRLGEQDPHAIADPKWTSLTEAMGPIGANDPEQFPHIARFAGPSFLAMTWPVLDAAGDYGKFNFGDVHTYVGVHHNPPKIYLQRVWLNNHYGQQEIIWLLYAFYGQHKYLDWARVNNHHTMNIDMVKYADPDNPLPFHDLGAFYHVKGFAHWGHDAAVVSHHSWPTFLNWNWLMTGNRRARDVADIWAKGVIQMQPSGGIIGREGGNALGHLVNFYQHRFDPRLLLIMDRFAEGMKSVPLVDQHRAYFNAATWYAYDMLRHDPQALEYFSDPDFLDDPEANYASQHLRAYLYLKTGDESHLDKLTRLYEHMGVQFIDEDHPYHGMWKYWFLETNWFAHKAMVVQKALAKADRRIKPDMKIQRPTLIGDGRYVRSGIAQYTLGVEKAEGKAIDIDAGGAPIAITGPDGAARDRIDAAASPGLYEIKVQSDKPIKVDGAEPFFIVRAGQDAALLRDTLATIAPLEGEGPIALSFMSGHKEPVRLAIVDADGNEAAAESQWNVTKLRKQLTVPAGGPWRIIAPYPTTLRPDRDIKLTPITAAD